MSENATTDTRSILEVMKHVANTTSELNENFWLNVRSANACSSENKKLIAKVDRVEMELIEVKKQNSQMQCMMKELISCIKL